MTLAAIAFNLMGNAVFSFGFSLLLTYAFVAALRVGPSHGRLFLWLLPFGKLGYDLVHGIPADSFVWLNVHGVPQELGTFMVGIGLDRPFLPSFRAVLGSNAGAFHYSQSGADLLYRGLSQKLSPALPLLIVAALLAVAALRLGLRLAGLARFVGESQAWLKQARELDVRRVGLRRVRILASSAYQGTPFTAGLLRPYVLVPAQAFLALPADAREAVLLHELAHARRHDPSLLLLVGVIGDVFWFLPGIAGLVRRIARDLELTADAAALTAGATRSGLAQALLVLSEGIAESAPAPALFGLKQSLLRERVDRLLAPKLDLPRLLYRRLVPRVLVVALFSAFVMRSVFFGNS